MATVCDLLDRLVDGFISGESPPVELEGLEVVVGSVARSVAVQPSAQARAAGWQILETSARAAGWHTASPPAA